MHCKSVGSVDAAYATLAFDGDAQHEVQHPSAYSAGRSTKKSCMTVAAISSIDLVVVDSQRMPETRIRRSAWATS